MIYDAIILGRGPLGVYTSIKLVNKGFKVLNIDCGTGLKNLKKKTNVNSNVLWKTQHQAPSLDESASDSRWHGGCMNLPLSELGEGYLKIPINEKSFIQSTENVKNFFNIKDFDFVNNRPISNKISEIKNYENVKYTYLTKDLMFEEKIKFLEEKDSYTFLDTNEQISFKLIPGKSVIVKSLDNNDNIFEYKGKQIFLCLGAIENARLLLNNSETLKLDEKNIGKNLNDHLRFPVASVEFKNFDKFRDIFDKKRNKVNQNNLWPRYIVENEDLKSYGFFKDWRDSNVFIRKFKFQFLKKIIPHNGTAVFYLFIEKLFSEGTNLNLSNQHEIIPNLNVNFNLNNLEINQINNIVDKYIEQLNNQFGNQIKNVERYKISLNEKFLKSVVSSNHPSGTTLMGINPSNSLVNNKLQLWQHPNIFIYGSGSLPRPYYIHPTFTSMVLADVSLNLI